jgi:hypothetical protein
MVQPQDKTKNQQIADLSAPVDYKKIPMFWQAF